MHSKTDIENVYLMAAGPIPPNPAELLGSSAMDDALLEAYNMFDIILIDTPPVLAVTDAQILANKCDGIVLVVQSEKTEKDKIVKAKQILDKASGKILGVVLNDKREEKEQYGYYFLKILYQVTQCEKRDKIKILENDWNVLSYLRLFCKIKLVSCEQI